MRAQTTMYTPAERHVPIGSAADVDLVQAVELALVKVGRREENQHSLTRVHSLAANLSFGARCALEPLYGAGVPQELLDGRGPQPVIVGSVCEFGSQLRPTVQFDKGPGGGVGGGVQPGKYQLGDHG